MTKKLEEHLYRSAHTKEEYIDPASLKRRLHLIAKGVGIPKPGEGDEPSSPALAEHVGGGGGGNSVTNSTASSAPPPVPLEAMSQGLNGSSSASATAGASSSSNNPQQKTNQAQHQEHQMQSLQAQSQKRQQQLQQMQKQNSQAAHSMANATSQQSKDGQSSTNPASTPLLPQDQAVPVNVGTTQETAANPGAPKSDKKKVILLQQQRRLLLLRHASKCDAGPTCRTKFCPQMVTLWKHMKKCRDKHCKVSHCLSSRCVLNHYRICKSEGKTASCAICAPVIQHIRQSSDGIGGGMGGSLGGGAGGMAGFDGDELDTLAMGSDGGLLAGEDPLVDAHTMIDTPGVGDDDVIGMGVGGATSQAATRVEPPDAFRTGAGNDSLSPLPTPGVPGAALAQAQEQQKNDSGISHAAVMGLPKGSTNNGGLPQAGLMCLPQSQPELGGNSSVQELQHQFQKKQLLLRQVQQQKANLFGQSQKLQQQLMAACNPQQAQQLQKQQTILQQLNQQFEQQQSILQSEIQCQAIILQQRQQQQQGVNQQGVNQQGANQQGANQQGVNQQGGGSQTSGTVTISNNYDLISTMSESKGKKENGTKSKGAKSKDTKALPTSGSSKKVAAAAGAKSSKRKTNDGKKGGEKLRPTKKSKANDGLSIAKASKPIGKSSESGTKTKSNPPADMTKKSSSDGALASSSSNNNSRAGADSSLIPSMSIPVIERHLDSLVNPGQITPRHIARKCLPLVKKLINHDDGWVFKDAVDPVELGIPEYFDIVENPMDLTLVVNKLEDGAYKDIGSFERDTKLVFENAILFNGADSDVGSMAQGLLDLFAADLKSTLKGEE